MKRVFALSAVLLALVLFGVAGGASGQMTDTSYGEGLVSPDGAISLPKNFRTDYVLLGAWSVAGDVDTGGKVGLHIVYAPKSAVEGYRKNGRFPDGTVLVKELFNGKTQTLTTGEATHADEYAGTFIMIKDDKGRFPDNPLWGDGWGWALFAADDSTNPVTKDYAADCLGCHEPVRASDLVYVQGYPVLKD